MSGSRKTWYGTLVIASVGQVKVCASAFIALVIVVSIVRSGKTEEEKGETGQKENG
jgi:hypothetical protein